MDKIQDYLRKNPWAVVSHAAAVLVGYALGLWL